MMQIIKINAKRGKKEIRHSSINVRTQTKSDGFGLVHSVLHILYRRAPARTISASMMNIAIEVEDLVAQPGIAIATTELVNGTQTGTEVDLTRGARVQVDDGCLVGPMMDLFSSGRALARIREEAEQEARRKMDREAEREIVDLIHDPHFVV